MGANSTKARILAAGKALFNENGYAALSAVDVAIYLGISPGHLYYHFKGKADIAHALIHEHIGEISAICDYGIKQCQAETANIETLWTQVHILVEEVYDVRFAYREASVLARAEPKIASQIKQANNYINNFCWQSLNGLAKNGAINANQQTIDGLAAQLALGIEYAHMKLEFETTEAITPRTLIERAAAIIMLPIAAFAKSED